MRWSTLIRRQKGLLAARIALALFALAAGCAASAQTFTALDTFPGGDYGAVPSSGYVIAPNGELYGTTAHGGDTGIDPGGAGILYKLNKNGVETLLYPFTGGADGDTPEHGLLRDSKGNLYGATYNGGITSSLFPQGAGVIFELDHQGIYHVLYAFTGGVDGANPNGELVEDKYGNLYGTARHGGDPNVHNGLGGGVVFEIVPSTKNETVLYTFTDGTTDGAYPESGLVLDDKSNLYGSSGYDGIGEGVVFYLDKKRKYHEIYAFTDGADGGAPLGLMIRDSAGNLYGTTIEGGSGIGSQGYGVVFKIAPSTKTETVLYTFTGGADGANPTAGLAMDSNGNLYGTTNDGGSDFGSAGLGVVFQLDPLGSETVLHTFMGGDDGYLPGSLLTWYKGSLYGAVSYGGSFYGADGYGLLFKLTP
jgi:uncharacterized repeat protein (TIGR03803 family)